MIVVDSSVWVPYFAGFQTLETTRLEQAAHNETVLVGDIVMLEILRGTRSDKASLLIERQLRSFPVVQMLDPGIAVAAARNYRRLRSLGITPRNSADLVIGTYCIEKGHALLQRDRDYLPMRDHLGLQLA
jgi:predicted nucleic acid-binding protein